MSGAVHFMPHLDLADRCRSTACGVERSTGYAVSGSNYRPSVSCKACRRTEAFKLSADIASKKEIRV